MAGKEQGDPYEGRKTTKKHRPGTIPQPEGLRLVP